MGSVLAPLVVQTIVRQIISPEDKSAADNVIADVGIVGPPGRRAGLVRGNTRQIADTLEPEYTGTGMFWNAEIASKILRLSMVLTFGCGHK